ncbi:SDR family NAD(P)-dependent oxidoreductase [Streptomyces anulatus]|uniref:SDR family NAD(P)-dependent oxidoreductase n=1 Tax=Streptomyces anulatus TaxID=1892 RepID=UPI003331681E
MRISGATVLLTGATGGIGRTLARQLHARGARLILTGRRGDELRALARQLGARAVTADLSDPDETRLLAEESADAQILIANAALPASGYLLDYTSEQIDRALTVNLGAPILLARLLAPSMAEAGRGHLCFVGSLSGKAATPASSLYTATKFGLRGFAHSLRQDLRGAGVGVSLVQPGFVGEAGMFADTGAPVPGGRRTVSPAEVADAVLTAIDRDRAETNIAPMPLRLRCAIANQFPGLAEKLGPADEGSRDAARQIVEAQRALR